MDKTRVFISGATGGFGRMAAVECAGRGYDLFLTDLNNALLKNFAHSLSGMYGVLVDYRSCDMSDFSSRSDLIDFLQNNGFCFHMLINIAGIDPEGPFLETSRQTIARVMNINLVSPLDMIRSLTALRGPHKPFRILNVCSMGGFFAMPVKAVYAASKRALIDMSRALREELKPLGITVTALCPAGMATNEVLVKNMSVQGIMGRLTTLQLSVIASNAIDRAEKGRAMYIPGIFNRFIVAFTRFIPPAVTCAYIYKRWQKTNRAFADKLKKDGLPDRT